MARTLDAFPLKVQSRYPWNRWLDGQVWELKHGEDFRGKSETFRTNAKHQARRRGGNVRTARLEREGAMYVVVQFYREV
jgi:hypothetical protein